jgi:diguanylate cyclase (GGDEF)-like protein
MNFNDLDKSILNKWIETTDVFLFRIDADMNIFDFSPNFKPYAEKFSNIFELITYTHRSDFVSKLHQCIQKKLSLSFITNFSFDSSNPEELPDTYKITMGYQADETIIVVAEIVCPLYRDDAQEYFRLIDDYSALSRKLQKSQYRLDKQNKKLEYLVEHDELTKIYNRKKIFEELHKEYNKFQRFGTVFSVAIIDIDNFKSINDTYGHQSGDAVLQTLALILKTSCREYDSVGRYGGEEFLFVFPSTQATDAKALIERILRKVNNTKIPLRKGKEVVITFSAGVSEIKQDTASKFV